MGRPNPKEIPAIFGTDEPVRLYPGIAAKLKSMKDMMKS